MEGFQVGQAVGKSRRSSLANTSEYMSGLTAERDKQKTKTSPLELLMLKQAIQPASGVYSWNPTTGKLEQEASVPKGSIVRNTTTREDIEDKESAKKNITGAGAQSSAINAAMQAAKSARNVKNILFPDGTPNSFRSDIATMKSPFLGRPTLSKDAQNVAREYGIALDLYNRQVTGAAFNQDEFNRRLDQFRVNLLSNPEAAFDSLSRLEELNNDYLKIADPSNMYHQSDSSVAEQKDPRTLYNELRSQGVPRDEAKMQAGLK